MCPIAKRKHAAQLCVPLPSCRQSRVAAFVESMCRSLGLHPRLNASCMPMQVSMGTALAAQMLNMGHGTVALMNARSKSTSCWQHSGLRNVQTRRWEHPCFEASAAARNNG